VSKSSVIKLRLEVLSTEQFSRTTVSLCDNEFQTEGALTLNALKCNPRYRQ